MHGPILRHRCTTGGYLWLCLAVALGLALDSQAAAARECHRETPLPTDVRLVAPGPQVPEAVARFAGAWTGVRLDRQGRDAQCHTLVVEEVLANGYARVTYSVGAYADWSRYPQFLHATGRIVDGDLRLHLPLPTAPGSPIGWSARRCRAPSMTHATGA